MTVHLHEMSRIAAVSLGQYAHSTSLRQDGLTAPGIGLMGGWPPLVPLNIAEESNCHDSPHS
jgi:hypothetical protein